MSDQYVHLDNGTVWPVNVGDIEWRLRYGEPTRSDLLIAASVLAIYTQMTSPQSRGQHAEQTLHRARHAQREATT
jgi:hypothetical protein